MHLHLDCQFGIAGDMLLASLIDAGADHEKITETLQAIPLENFSLEAKRVSRGAIAAMLAEVEDLSQSGCRDHHHDRHDHHSHDHDHGHNPDHDHHHPHDHHPHDHQEHRHHDGDKQAQSHEHRHGPHRHLSDLLELLAADAIPQRVRERAARVFRIVAEAEAAVHGQPVEKVHFHEISGIDTAVDVIGSCLALEQLQIDSISASPVSVGSGMVMCDHGIFPVPAPATLEILKSHNIPWRAGGEGERSTPTGIALLAGLAESFGASPELTVTRIGYGAGHKDFADVPNLLRAIIGKPGKAGGETGWDRKRGATAILTPDREPDGAIVPVVDRPMLPAEVEAMLPGDAAPGGDRVMEFKFAIDDMTAEELGHLAAECLRAGAVEAYSVPAVMKKSRPGHEVTVLSPPDCAALVADVIWRESSTFGLRLSERSRLTLSRDIRTVSVNGQKIRVKLGWRNGEIIRRQPEFEDCRAASLATGQPLRRIFDQAKQAAADLE
ncbi:MAG: nickel pincer cofactor biosynthesis protein LarC [Planctomycetes bacterium]|nr:nickel pincer cofactor biosynthesis protein LarC [Planctomycetota bacterium]